MPPCLGAVDLVPIGRHSPTNAYELAEVAGRNGSATAVRVVEQALEHLYSFGNRLLDSLCQELPVDARRDDRLHVRMVLRTACEQLHDHDQVDGGNGNTVTHRGMREPVFDDAQGVGERDLININTVELDDGHAHRHEPAGMRLERLFTNQKIDVFRRPWPVAIGVGPERTHERMPNPGISEHPGDFAYRAFIAWNRPQRPREVGLPAGIHEAVPLDRNLGFQRENSKTSPMPGSVSRQAAARRRTCPARRPYRRPFEPQILDRWVNNARGQGRASVQCPRCPT